MQEFLFPLKETFENSGTQSLKLDLYHTIDKWEIFDTAW